MTPRDAAIQAYADYERRMRDHARATSPRAPLTARKIRQKALMCHRAMMAELLDPPIPKRLTR